MFPNQYCKCIRIPYYIHLPFWLNACVCKCIHTTVLLPYFFGYEAQHFSNESLPDSSKSIVISGCVLEPSIFRQQNKIESNF